MVNTILANLLHNFIGFDRKPLYLAVAVSTLLGAGYHFLHSKHESKVSYSPPSASPIANLKTYEKLSMPDNTTPISLTALSPEDTMNRSFDDIPTINYTGTEMKIPAKFNAKDNWPNCSDLIGKIWDQGQCQACWAVSAASVMSDRLCIASNGTVKPILSPQDLICNCNNCTRNNDTNQDMAMCRGGDSEAAWQYWRDVGLVTGGEYGTNDTCLPYLSGPCLHNPSEGPTGDMVQCGYKPSSYKCPSQCQNSNTSVQQEKKYRGAKFYYIDQNDTDIQKEIIQHGPVQAKFTFDETLMKYTNGLFSCPKDSKLDSSHVHSVKIIGWGVEDATPYWLCINSYNTGWGDQGMFKIQRGVNMCLIEASVLAGLPLLDDV